MQGTYETKIANCALAMDSVIVDCDDSNTGKSE